MKPPRSKRDIQSDLENQIAQYLQSGGDIKEVERGESGLDHAKPWINPFKSGDTPTGPEPRTPVPDVVAAIDARKQPQKDAQNHRKRPHKKWIYDDFGEPIRWVWSDS